MRAPSFRCTEESDGSLILHYYSDRAGLEYIVIGIVKVSAHTFIKEADFKYTFDLHVFLQAVASKLHGVEVDIKIIKRKGDPIVPAVDAENNYALEDVNSNDNMILSNATNKYDITINNNNNNTNIEIQVPENRSEKSESLYGNWKNCCIVIHAILLAINFSFYFVNEKNKNLYA
jgi:hypothetical protein